MTYGLLISERLLSLVELTIFKLRQRRYTPCCYDSIGFLGSFIESKPFHLLERSLYVNRKSRHRVEIKGPHIYVVLPSESLIIGWTG